MNVDSGEIIREFIGHNDEITDIAFSPDAERLLSGSLGTIYVWDIVSAGIVREFQGHRWAIHGVDFSADGRFVVSIACGTDSIHMNTICSGGGEAFVWHHHTLSELQTWVQENRVLADFTCSQRASFGLSPCVDDVVPTMYVPDTATPFATWTSIPTGEALATLTPSPTMTLSPTPQIRDAGFASIGNNPGELSPASIDVWQYEGEAGKILNILVEAENPARSNSQMTRVPDGLDTILLIRYPDGTEREFDDIEHSVITNSQVNNLILPETGTYTFEIRSWLDESAGAYSLIIEHGELTATPSPTHTVSPTAIATPLQTATVSEDD